MSIVARLAFLSLAALVALAACDAPLVEMPVADDAGTTPLPDLTTAAPLPDSVFPVGGADLFQSLPGCNSTDPRSPAAEIYAFPEAGEAPYLQVLKEATQSIRVMVYLMGRGGILDTLKQKAGAGVSVRVILDQSQKGTNQKYFDELVLAGAHVEWSDPQFTYMHAKVIIADQKSAIISTGNYSVYQIQQERNFGARVTDPGDLGNLIALFDADWDRRGPDLSCTRLLVSPVNARARLLAHIGSATKTLYIESMQFADTDVRNQVAARKAAGVDVRVLLADPSWIDSNNAAATFLKSRNIPVRWRTNPSVHTKSIVVDGARAFLGSENLSWTSLSKNREVGLLIDSAVETAGVATMSTIFDTDWATATPF